MKEYIMKITDEVPSVWSDVAKANIESYVWGGAERAYATYGQLVYAKTGDEKAGLYIRLFCEETNPVSIETQYEGKVCCDSCMEFFFGMQKSEEEELLYLNVETNSLGVSYISFGADRYGRKFIDELGIERFPISISIGEDGWEALIFIPEADLKKVFKLDEIDETIVMRGNFFKCDENANAPFGTWSPVTTAPKPDFHRPECFGRIYIKR